MTRGVVMQDKCNYHFQNCDWVESHGKYKNRLKSAWEKKNIKESAEEGESRKSGTDVTMTWATSQRQAGAGKELGSF